MVYLPQSTSPNQLHQTTFLVYISPISITNQVYQPTSWSTSPDQHSTSFINQRHGLSPPTNIAILPSPANSNQPRSPPSFIGQLHWLSPPIVITQLTLPTIGLQQPTSTTKMSVDGLGLPRQDLFVEAVYWFYYGAVRSLTVVRQQSTVP